MADEFETEVIRSEITLLEGYRANMEEEGKDNGFYLHNENFAFVGIKIDILSKLLPKKVLWDGRKYSCPHCKRTANKYATPYNGIPTFRNDYCCYCGQAFDWSVE